MSKQTFLEKCYKDKEGRVVLYQTPNAPLVLWVVSTIFSHLITNGVFHQIFSLIAFGAIFTWSWLELFQGSSYFRRLLGAIVLVGSIVGRL